MSPTMSPDAPAQALMAEVLGHPQYESFREFVEQNPELIASIYRNAKTLQAQGYLQYGLRALYEVARWESDCIHGPRDEAGPRLNSNYLPLLARMLMAADPALRGFFTTRCVTSKSEVTHD